MRRIDRGPFGTELTASLPQALGDWGFVDRIKLTLRRKYVHAGRHLSYFNAGCPAVRGANVATFPLASASFHFSDRKPVTVLVPKTCGVKG
jgi:hypothetical protein